MCLSCHHRQYRRKLGFCGGGVLVEDFLDSLGGISGGEGDFEGLGAQDVVGKVGEEGIEEEGEDVCGGGGVDEVGSFVEEATEGVCWCGG